MTGPKPKKNLLQRIADEIANPGSATPAPPAKRNQPVDPLGKPDFTGQVHKTDNKKLKTYWE